MRDELSGSTLLSDLTEEKKEEKNIDKEQMEFSTPIEQVMDTPPLMQPQEIMSPVAQKVMSASQYPFNLKKNQVEALVAGVAAVIGFSDIVQTKVLDMIPQALNDSGKLSGIGMLVMVQCGLKPVFVDIDWEDLNWDLEQVENKITERTVGAISSPVLGNPYNMSKFVDLCRRKSIALIADNCDSLGSKWHGNYLTDYAVAASCSFYPPFERLQLFPQNLYPVYIQGKEGLYCVVIKLLFLCPILNSYHSPKCDIGLQQFLYRSYFGLGE